jgi:hypothetical protein
MSFTARIQESLEEHRQFAMLAVLFVSFRALAVPLLAPGGFITDAGPDDLYYLNFSALSSAGYYPFLDYWSDYPPLFPWMAILAYRVSLALPAWSNPLLPFKAILGWSFVPFDLGALVLVYAVALRLYQQRQAEWVATAYAVSFVPLFVLLTWFDTVALFFLLLGVWGVVRDRPVASGLGIGLGFLTKPFPLVVAPAAVQVFRRWPRWPIFGGVALLVIAAVLVPFVVASPEYTLATIRAPVTGTAPYETIWALLEGVIDFGIVAPLNERIDPATAIRPFESSLPWTWITLAFAGLGLFLWTRRIDWEDPQRSVAFVGLTWSIMLLYSKGFSPQWHVYTVVLALLSLPGWRGVIYSIFLSALMAWEWPVAYYVFRQASWVAVVVIVLRTLTLIALTIDFAAQVFPKRQRLSRVARMGLPVALEIAVVAAIALTPGMLRAYRDIQTEADTLAPLVEAIQSNPETQQIVVTPQYEIVTRLTAPLRDNTPVMLLPQVYDNAWEPVDDWMDENTNGFERVWLVVQQDTPFTVTTGDEMEAWLGYEWCPGPEIPADGVLVRSYDLRTASGECAAQ